MRYRESVWEKIRESVTFLSSFNNETAGGTVKSKGFLG
jgi:hypothetical protein